MKKKAKLVIINKLYYITSNDVLKHGDIAHLKYYGVVGGLRVVVDKYDSGQQYIFKEKIIAMPEQIGWIRTRPKEMGEAAEPISINKIEEIISNKGCCEIEIDKKDNIVLINNKIILIP